MHISTKRIAHVKRNIFGNLVSSGFTKDQVCFALEFTNADYKRYTNYEYEAEPASQNQKGYFKALHSWHTRPGKELPLPAIEFLGTIKKAWPEFSLLRGETKRHYSEAIDTIQLSTPSEILTPYFRARTYSIFSGSSANKLQEVMKELNLTNDIVLTGLCEVAAGKAYDSWRG